MKLRRYAIWGAAVAILTAMSCILAISSPAWSQPLVDGAEDVAIAMRRKATELVRAEEQRAQLETKLKEERAKAPQTDVQRDLNREAIVQLEQELDQAKVLEDKLRVEINALRTPPRPTPLPPPPPVPRPTPEVDEEALHLTQSARQDIQDALRKLGFDTGAIDGSFGPRTREMIEKWQRSKGHQVTGFISGAQQQDLLREAKEAVRRIDYGPENNQVLPATKPPPAPRPPPPTPKPPDCIGFMCNFEK